jgi:hypothetical protein
MRLSLEIDAFVAALFVRMRLTVRTLPHEVGLLRSGAASGHHVSLSSGIGRENKDLIMRTNLGGRIAHKIDSVDVASESGNQAYLA